MDTEKEISPTALTEDERQNMRYSIVDYGTYSSDHSRLLVYNEDPDSDYALSVYYILDGTEVICDDACTCCDYIKEFVLPDGVKYIGESAFARNYELMNMKIPKSVVSIGKYAFEGCKSIYDITIPPLVSNISEGLLAWCGSLHEVTIEGTITSIGCLAFAGSELR
ncbi:MAG: leucine-rich repeat domain-containing protein, partial [Bacteroidales bacterium]|nr:leucine-rich repeat domain-containing protein [Bacteroidales bacterium]